MPRTALPKLKLGRRAMPTKALDLSLKGPCAPNMLFVFFATLILVIVVVSILQMTGTINLFKRKKQRQARNEERSVGNRKRRSRTDAAAVDRRTDEEAPRARPVPVKGSTVGGRARIEQPKESPAAPKQGFFESQFRPLDEDKFNTQFSKQSTQLSKKTLSSQLKKDTIMPQFSTDRQPTRQTGMPLDMVYTELRSETPGGKSAVKMSSDQVPFGGSEFHEMRRIQSLGQWKDTY